MDINRGIENINTDHPKSIDIKITILVNINKGAFFKLSISLREFCKILILTKYCIDKVLTYRTPLVSDGDQNCEDSDYYDNYDDGSDDENYYDNDNDAA